VSHDDNGATSSITSTTDAPGSFRVGLAQSILIADVSSTLAAETGGRIGRENRETAVASGSEGDIPIVFGTRFAHPSHPWISTVKVAGRADGKAEAQEAEETR
jgi:hypothetical protein